MTQQQRLMGLVASELGVTHACYTWELLRGAAGEFWLMLVAMGGSWVSQANVTPALTKEIPVRDVSESVEEIKGYLYLFERLVNTMWREKLILENGWVHRHLMEIHSGIKGRTEEIALAVKK